MRKLTGVPPRSICSYPQDRTHSIRLVEDASLQRAAVVIDSSRIRDLPKIDSPSSASVWLVTSTMRTKLFDTRSCSPRKEQTRSVRRFCRTEDARKPTPVTQPTCAATTPTVARPFAGRIRSDTRRRPRPDGSSSEVTRSHRVGHLGQNRRVGLAARLSGGIPGTRQVPLRATSECMDRLVRRR